MIFEADDIANLKKQALQWAASFEVCCYLDSNHFTEPYGKFDAIIAAGVKHEVTADAGGAFEALRQFRAQHTGWMTGFIGYDLKNEVEQLQSSHPNKLHFPDLYFFVPKYLIIIQGKQVEIKAGNAAEIWQAIHCQPQLNSIPAASISLKGRFDKQAYTDSFNRIKQHITRGDIYVTNFCQEFYAEHSLIDPVNVFVELNYVSPTPFACFFKYRQQYIMCASPERFLARRGSKLISQPIKGTVKRGLTATEDEALKKALRHNIKEQQENVMIVDLVRNDLTKSAEPGTVKAEELFGIYTFKQVHQMISTITCELRKDLSSIDAIRNTFPMGSMTGAPKHSAMQLMEEYERTRRGIYSGAIGYFAPDDDFDFNVAIRTLFYNADNGYLSFQVGSAVTFDATADQEYAECLLKAKAIMEVLGTKVPEHL